MPTIVRRLSPADAEAYRRLRLRGLRESPTAYGSSYGEEVKFPLGKYRGWLEQSDDKWVFGAFEDERLTGIVTLVRDEKRKARHKASLYGFYIERSMRRKGIGRRLLDCVIEAARHLRGLRQIRLAVVGKNGPALRLYENAGFKIFGREEAALCVAGKFYAELYLVLILSKARPPGPRVVS